MEETVTTTSKPVVMWFYGRPHSGKSYKAHLITGKKCGELWVTRYENLKRYEHPSCENAIISLDYISIKQLEVLADLCEKSHLKRVIIISLFNPFHLEFGRSSSFLKALYKLLHRVDEYEEFTTKYEFQVFNTVTEENK